MQRIVVLLALISAFTVQVNGQLKDQIPKMMSVKPKEGIICYGRNEDQNSVFGPPIAYEIWKSKGSRTNSTTATFEVTYVDFPADAQAAFQKAVDIWSTLIESKVPIRILAQWQVISDGTSAENILGGANPGTFFRDFDGAQQHLTWYPVAMAEKMAGEDLNDITEPDIFAQFNSAYPKWYFGTDGIIQSQKTDFVTVVLHEIGHGLGITHGYTASGTDADVASYFSGLHVVYDHFVQNDASKNVVQTYTLPSAILLTDFTSGLLYFTTPQLAKVSNTEDNRAKLYAPSTFSPGSSIAHLDESIYNLTENALMTPQIGTAEVHHDPGPIAMKMLGDMGWVNSQIIHTRLPNTEDVSNNYLVKVKIVPDNLNGYDYLPGEVKLHHTIDGTNFTEVAMTPTGNADEFSSTIPATGTPTTYGYYISIKDNLNRNIYKPGFYTEDGSAPEHLYYVFEAGPDTQAPFINHSPKPFILASDTEISLEAIISDNIGILASSVEYQINGVNQTPVAMSLKAGTDSTYIVTIPLPGLQDGDQIKYRILATDNSVAQNKTAKPSASTFYSVNVVSLAATQDNYQNNFNSPSSDFFGDQQFSIITPTGFTNGAIHSIHPYPDGSGTNFESNYIYQLRIPIRLNAVDATIKFDEIVLVEPGDAGSVFGSDSFYDYVIVEGSKDGGVTWLPLVNGYDCRTNTAWLNKFNSSSDAASPPNSTGTGDPTLYKSRTIDMLSNGNFAAGDEIVIRFRLFTDQLVHGWGWSIDNLKIQIDDTPPTVLHNHIDYLFTTNSTLSITTNVTDNSGIDKLYVDYIVNNGSETTYEFPVNDNTSQYTLDLTINGMSVGDVVQYRIRCSDKNSNEAVLPTGGYFNVPAISIGSPVSQYISDFNSSNTDFVGNFFSISQPSGFNNGAIHSSHPYFNGFGLTNSTSSYIYMLTKPVTISSSNSYMTFDEIAVVEYVGASAKDFVVVEASKDNGTTWEKLLNPYAASAFTDWSNAYILNQTPTPGNFHTRLFSLTSSGKFVAGDNILIRFRLSADAVTNSWGWSIDNLSIQGPVTSVETKSLDINLYPNPIREGKLILEIPGTNELSEARVKILNAQGSTLLSDEFVLDQKANRREYTVDGWSEGIYFIRIDSNGSSLTKKFIKSNG